MKKEIEMILSDLYNVDPELRQHEAELKKIIIQIMSSKPNAKFDEKFRRQLRAELMERAAELKTGHAQKVSFFERFKIYYVAGVVAILVLAIIPAVLLTSKKNPSKLSLTDFGLNITSVGKHAFELKPSPAMQATDSNSIARATAEQALGLGGGGGMAQAPAADKMASGMVIYPPIVAYKYVYKGQGFTLDETSGEVLKRLKGSQSNLAISSLLKSFDLGTVDLTTFSNVKFQTLNFVEDKDLGYSIYIDLNEGMVSIGENWEKWQEPCTSESCFEQYQIKPEDMPPDEVVIKLADDFVKSHEVDLSIFGQPFVQDTWQWLYANAEDKANFYIGANAQVIYPLVINGETVYDESGNVYGLGVNVNVKKMKASGLYNLTSQNYQSSTYELETDSNRILSIVKQGGYRYYPYDATEVVEVEVGEPEFGYMKVWNYTNEPGKQADELLVPAIIFPIKNSQDYNYLGRTAIAVPLVKELLDQDQANQPEIIPMPLETKVEAE